MPRLPLAAVLAFLLLAAACGDGDGDGTEGTPPGGVPSEAPFIEGLVTSVSGDAGLRSFVVESADPEAEIDIAGVAVDEETSVLRETAGDRHEPAGREAIGEGRAVRVWITGPVRESYPVQVTASHVLLTAEA